jgi:hypothetical protein
MAMPASGAAPAAAPAAAPPAAAPPPKNAAQAAAGKTWRLESLNAEATWKLSSGTGSSSTTPAAGPGGGRRGGTQWENGHLRAPAPKQGRPWLSAAPGSVLPWLRCDRPALKAGHRGCCRAAASRLAGAPRPAACTAAGPPVRQPPHLPRRAATGGRAARRRAGCQARSSAPNMSESCSPAPLRVAAARPTNSPPAGFHTARPAGGERRTCGGGDGGRRR